MRMLLAAVAALALSGSAAPKGTPQTLASFMAANGYRAIPLAKLPTGHETIQVTINGVTGTFILDSGAGATVVNRASLARFGLGAGDRTRENVTGIGAGGVFGIESYRVGGLMLGGQAVPLSVVRASDLGTVTDVLRAATKIDVQGVVGQDVLTRYRGVIDVANSTLYLQVP